jgi:hypothetical protein
MPFPGNAPEPAAKIMIVQLPLRLWVSGVQDLKTTVQNKALDRVGPQPPPQDHPMLPGQ